MFGVVVVEPILAKRIKYLREHNGLAQKHVAEKLGIKNNTLSGYEAGRREPDASTLNKIAEFYGVSVDYLLGRTDDPTPEQPSIFFYGGELSEDEQEHLEEELKIYRKRKQQWLEQQEKNNKE
ncbi:helix-turn-helix domain-containing protein [Salibacterium aidingense]|uniref:helix-turn-helix domain-containing protein n=1 Tax=Salibacterium aidingense TaxID=384933 RepID=UPI000417D9EB|nr:helix-turn-helix transcriptional regulator [Salibacterium aidingense]